MQPRKSGERSLMVTMESLISQVQMVHSKGTVAGILSHPPHLWSSSPWNPPFSNELIWHPSKKTRGWHFSPISREPLTWADYSSVLSLGGKKKGNTTHSSAKSHQQTTEGSSNEKQDNMWVCFLSLQLCYARVPGLSMHDLETAEDIWHWTVCFSPNWTICDPKIVTLYLQPKPTAHTSAVTPW